MNFQFLQACIYFNFKLFHMEIQLYVTYIKQFNNPIPHWGKADLACVREDDIVALVRKVLAPPNLVTFLTV